jgi:hypothetical protein
MRLDGSGEFFYRGSSNVPVAFKGVAVSEILCLGDTFDPSAFRENCVSYSCTRKDVPAARGRSQRSVIPP